MTDWQRQIDLYTEMNQAREGTISTQELSGIVAGRLKSLVPFSTQYDDLNEERLNLIDEFESLANDPTASIGEFDSALDMLFDWGDTSLGSGDNFFQRKKTCWINVAFAPKHKE